MGSSGSTAAMLFSDAVVIAVGGALVCAACGVAQAPMTLVSFDPEFAAASGLNVRQVDLAMMALVMGVTIVGLKIVGLILIVALLIIPPVTARFWTNRTEHVVLGAGLLGAVSGYVGAAISATAPALPTGPIIVLVAFALFALSLFFAPERGVLAAILRRWPFQRRVHLRQGLLALAQSQPIYEKLTLRLMQRQGLVRATAWRPPDGIALASKTLRDEKRWEVARSAMRTRRSPPATMG